MTGRYRVAIVGLLVAALSLAAVPATANDSDILRRGGCTAASSWKLKLSEENGRIEVEYEVDQNRVGDVWRVALRDDGARFFLGRRTTQAPSGSFEVHRLTTDGAGDDVITARARNLRTDEICRGRAVFP